MKLDSTKKYLLGCSYGPDSMALFSMLLKDGYNFDVAIVNYHLREESDDEVKGLQDFCNKNNKKLYILDVKNIPSKNIEESCRNIRYEFFANIIRNEHLDGLVIAHNQDDLIETYLMQKQRQICTIFYGIKYKSYVFGIDVYRPLLDFSKNDLLNFCNENNVPFMVDKSNFDTKFLRNKIRHEIVSKLSVKERQKFINDIKFENEELGKMLASIETSKLNSVTYLKNLDFRSFPYALNMAKNKVGRYNDLSKKQCDEILKILNSNKPNISCNIFKDLKFIKEYDEIRFENPSVVTKYSFILNEPGKLDTEYFYLDFINEFSNRNVSIDDFPITIRNADKNDTYIIKDYCVSVSRLFIDWKMPLSLRKRWPVIVSKTGKVIYVPRYRKDFKIDSSANFYVKID